MTKWEREKTDMIGGVASERSYTRLGRGSAAGNLKSETGFGLAGDEDLNDRCHDAGTHRNWSWSWARLTSLRAGSWDTIAHATLKGRGVKNTSDGALRAAVNYNVLFRPS